MKKFGWRLTGRRKCEFLIFVFFHFSKFQMTIAKNLTEKPSFWILKS